MRKYAVTKEKLEAEIANVKYTKVGATTMLYSVSKWVCCSRRLLLYRA